MARAKKKVQVGFIEVGTSRGSGCVCTRPSAQASAPYATVHVLRYVHPKQAVSCQLEAVAKGVGGARSSGGARQ